jgi:hypothetical protein
MPKPLLGVALTAILVGGVILVTPDVAMGQTCWGNCDICEGSGHSYGVAGNPATGLDAHGCGGHSDCTTTHEKCPMEQEEDVEALLDYENLTGWELFDVVERNSATMFVNLERRSIQKLNCDLDAVVYNLPLSSRQLSELQAAAEAELQEALFQLPEIE